MYDIYLTYIGRVSKPTQRYGATPKKNKNNKTTSMLIDVDVIESNPPSTQGKMYLTCI